MDRKGRKRVWDDVDIITERGTDKRKGCCRKCGVFDEDGIFGRIQTYVCLSVNGMVISSDPAWLQGAFSALVAIFDRVCLQTNVGKKVSMACHPCWVGGGDRTEAATVGG